MASEELGYIDISCDTPAAIRLWTIARWNNLIDKVLEARSHRERMLISVGQLKDVIKSAGFGPTPFGLLAHMGLRAHCDFLHAWSYDIMHTTFQDGFMSNAMWLLCLNIARTKYHSNYESLVRHIRECQVPMGRGSIKCIYNQLLSEKMVKKHTARKAIVANASVKFSLYPIQLDWALMELDADVEEHVAVYTAA